MTQIANLISERLHEWYGLHFPELESTVKETEYINLISELGDRNTIIDSTKNEKLKSLVPSESIGTGLDPNDKTAVMGFAQELKNVHSSLPRMSRTPTRRCCELRKPCRIGSISSAPRQSSVRVCSSVSRDGSFSSIRESISSSIIPGLLVRSSDR